MARVLRLSLFSIVLASTGVQAAGIFTCVDAQGRRFTSDRPIAECADREQKQLKASGTLLRTVPPSMTASERAAHEQAQQRLAEERQRQEEERRMERALLVRYPTPAVHASERAKALTAAQDVIAIAQDRIGELAKERKALEAEAEFYKTPAQWPAKLKRQFDDNEQGAAAQQRQIARQEEEKKRIHKRFDEESARLKVLWAKRQGTAAAMVAAPVQR
jgi:hypothetical protein